MHGRGLTCTRLRWWGELPDREPGVHRFQDSQSGALVILSAAKNLSAAQENYSVILSVRHACSMASHRATMMSQATPTTTRNAPPADSGFIRGLSLFDSTMIVVGSMIGSGIFIVSADISRQTGSTGGLLLAWVIAGLMTVAAALSYGELAAMMPQAGGQYIYLRESYSPLWGFLYGWTLFLVIQSGTIAAVAVAFARYLGVMVPAISPTAWIVPPIRLSSSYAISLSWQQLVGIMLILLLTAANTRGLRLGKSFKIYLPRQKRWRSWG